MQLYGIAKIDVFMVASAPVEGVSLGPLDALDVDIPLGENIQVVLRKVVADHADDPHRGEKAGAEREISRRPAQNTLGRAKWRLNGIESNRADYQHAHRYFPMIGLSSARNFFGIRDRSVMIASFNAEAQEQARAGSSFAAAPRMVFWARSTLFLSTVNTWSIST